MRFLLCPATTPRKKSFEFLVLAAQRVPSLRADNSSLRLATNFHRLCARRKQIYAQSPNDCADNI